MGGNILSNKLPFGIPQMTLGKLLMTSLEQSQLRYVGNWYSLPSPLPNKKCLTPPLKMDSILGTLREPERIWVLLYLLFRTLFKGRQTAEEQMLYASFWHALTQRSKLERQLKLHANLSSLGQVVSKRDTLDCGKKPRYCHTASPATSPLRLPSSLHFKSYKKNHFKSLKKPLSRYSHQTSNHATYRHGWWEIRCWE